MDKTRSHHSAPLPYQHPSSVSLPKTPVSSGVDAELRLLELGLSLDVLEECLSDGSSAYRSTTADHPTSYAGLRMWAETTASLRRNLALLDWESEDVSNVPLVVNRTSGRALIVTAGDGAAGDERYRPQVRYERRDIIQRLVNGELDSLFRPGRRPDWEVWFLLHNVSHYSMSAELARPTGVSSDGLVSDWAERILLPPEKHEIVPSETIDMVPPEVSIDVQRRSG